MRSMLARHLHIPHVLYCVTDDPVGLDPDIRVVPLPDTYRDTPRCRRRMQQYDRAFATLIGPRILSLDLDIVIVDDITPIVDRPEPVVCWKVGYADVYTTAFILFDAGALHGAWERFHRDPEGYPKATGERGASDQAMLNLFLSTRPPIAYWTEADGFVHYFGDGYERLAHHGVGPDSQELPKGARIVVLGSADKAVMDEGRLPWISVNWR